MVEDLSYKLFETVPIYPEEILAKDLADKLGIDTERAVGIIGAASTQCLIAENVMGKAKKYFTYPDKKSKEKTLKFLREGGYDAEIRDSNEE